MIEVFLINSCYYIGYYTIHFLTLHSWRYEYIRVAKIYKLGSRFISNRLNLVNAQVNKDCDIRANDSDNPTNIYSITYL